MREITATIVPFEEWRPTHHPDYDVSNLGRVRSRKLAKIRILRGGTHWFGYPMVVFYPEVTGHTVHALVARAFLGPCPEGCEVLHKDDDPSNPRVDNLRYGTHRENVHQTLRHGRQRRRKLTEDQVRDIRAQLETLRRPTPARRLIDGTCAAVAKTYGVSERCIEAVWLRANYKNVA